MRAAAVRRARPRLLVVNQYYAPAREATGQLLASLCEGLADEWEVTVVAGTVAGAAGPGRVRRRGVEVVRVPSTAFARRRLSLRALNYLTYLVLAGAATLRGRRPDVVLAMTDPPVVGVAALVAARRFRSPLVVVSQDVFPETAVAVGRLPRPLVAPLAAAAGLPLRHAARVVAIGETMRRRLEAKGVVPARLHVIPNWVDTERLTPTPRDNAWARAHGLAGRFVVMHSGNVGYAQDLDALVRAAALLRRLERLLVVVVGGGARRDELEGLARRLDAPVAFLPYQPADVVRESLSAADLHAVGLARGLAGYVVPSRVLGVLAVGRPVVAHAEDESDTARLVREAGCGVVVPPGDPERLAAAIRSAYEGELELAAMGRRGREYAVAHADSRRALERYRALLAELVSPPGA